MEFKKTLKEKLHEKEEIIFAYLFGSKVTGTSNKLSDVDIAIYLDRHNMPKSSPYGYKSDLIVEMEEELGEEVDIVILNEASLFLAYNILKEGQLIMCRSDEKRTEFHFRVVRDYLDFKPFIQVQNYYLKERIKKGSIGGS